MERGQDGNAADC